MGNLNSREAIILAILVGDELYGLAIRVEFEKRTKSALPLGSLYVCLGRMEEKGYIAGRYGESTPERGGNRRKYFSITANGQRALKQYASRLNNAHNPIIGALVHG